MAFTDADGNIITSVDGSGSQNDAGVTIVTSDSLVGTHFLNSGPDHGGPVTKIEIDDDMGDIMDHSSHGKLMQKGKF